MPEIAGGTTSGSCAHVSRLAERTVPTSVPFDGMTFAALPPAWIEPHVMTVPERGSMRRSMT